MHWEWHPGRTTRLLWQERRAAGGSINTAFVERQNNTLAPPQPAARPQDAGILQACWL
ncbi:MAG: hypothetical protein QXR19_01245 [Candidatus Jordarchaeaceae archaeon]